MRKSVVILGLAALVGGVIAVLVLGRGQAGQPLVLYGNVDVREVQLAFRQGGRLEKVLCDEGDTVHAGQVIGELDAVPLRQAVAVVEAERRQAEADLARLRRGSRPQEIAQAEEAERMAAATAAHLEAECVRNEALQAQHIIAVSDWEALRTRRDEAVAALAAARSTLALRREGFRAEDIAAGEARLAAAEARLAQARTALEDARLVAPADGVVLTRAREPGSMVAAGGSVLTLSLRDPVYVRAYVAESDLGRVAPGTPVSLRSDSSPQVYAGHVGAIAPRAEFTPKSVETASLRTDLVYRLRIVVPTADATLVQGMPVTITVAPPVGDGKH
jgi:HlyD family secretion protein